MDAGASRPGGLPNAFTPTRIALGILVVLMAVGLALPDAAETWVLIAYLGLVVVTAVVINGVHNEPGLWLGRRAVRRGIVVAIGAICAGLLMVTPTVPGDNWSLILLLVLMILLNIALGRATQRIATAADSWVDERQEALRNRAHRIAYVVFALVAGGLLVTADVANAQTRAWLGDVLRGGGFFVFLELLFVLPGMVVAFLEPDRLLADGSEAVTASRQAKRARTGILLLAVTIAIPLALSLLVVVLPTATSGSIGVRVLPGYASLSGSRTPSRQCRVFADDIIVGRGIQAAIPVNALACWNGRTATASYGMNASDCNPGDYAAVSVTTIECSRTTATDGTLRFVYQARISPALLPFLGRDVTVEIVMDKDGHVLQFP
jgi:hypothetical protein